MPELSDIGAFARRHDPDRYFTALFAPAARREALFALYAFNHELARARETVREPFAALIRLQWWREVAEGARRRHEVATPLGEAIDAGHLAAPDLAALAEAREAEAEPMETREAFDAYLLGAQGGLMVAAARALGHADAEALRPWGAAYGLAGQLRSIHALARQGRCTLPEDLLAEHGLTPHAVIADPAHPGLTPVRAALLTQANGWLAARPPVPRATRAAALPAVYARRDLDRRCPPGERPFADRLAVTWAALTGTT